MAKKVLELDKVLSLLNAAAAFKKANCSTQQNIFKGLIDPKCSQRVKVSKMVKKKLLKVAKVIKMIKVHQIFRKLKLMVDKNQDEDEHKIRELYAWPSTKSILFIQSFIFMNPHQ